MEYKLKDLTVDGKGTYGIGASAIPFDKAKPTYLRITDINDDGTLNFTDLKSVDTNEIDKYQLKENDIVFARTGNSTGRTYFYEKQHGNFVFAGFLIKFSLDANKVNPRILKYYTHSKVYYDWVKSFDTGGTRGNINAATYGEMILDLPDRKLQDKIVDILSSLDKKIETNNKINANLEEMAQAIFKNWFVDFAPFKDGKFVESELGMIPEGWRVGTIGDYCKVKSGYAFKSSWWTNEGDKVIKIKNISESGALDLTDCACISSENTAKAQNFKAIPGDLIIAMTGATIGKFNVIPRLDGDYYINQRVGKFFLGEEPLHKLPFIYCVLKEDIIINQIINKGQGSAQPNISGSDIENVFIAYNESIIDEFNNKFLSTFETIIRIQQENARLASLRDTLLPRLMSGEIEV